MKKILTIISFTLLFTLKVLGQAIVEIPFSVEDSHGNSRTLIFGLDLTATSGIDAHLGEQQLPITPAGAFDARFISKIGQSQLSEGTIKDIRNAPAFPFNGTYTHRIKFQAGDPNWELQTITVSWNLPPQIAAGSTITNTPFGGSNSQPFLGTGSMIIEEPLEYDRLDIVIVYSDILPVELTSFSANIYGQRVLLNWTTATETNNSGFEILRFTQNDNDWSTIGFVPGFGTTTEPKSYSFIDDLSLTPNLTHTLHYRIKQIDFDGSFTYSNEIEVDVDFTPKEFVLYQNYPNPFNPSTKISWQSPVGSWQTLKIYDILGNEVITLVDEYRAAGKYEIEFNLASGIRNPASGVYFYKLIAGEFTQTRKMIILR